MSFGSIVLILSIAAFAGIVWWAYSPRFKKTHEQDGMIPFLDSKTPPPEAQAKDEGATTTDKSKS